ncbi:50S ribosomal protein L4 [Methylomonas koyamae]|uniref:Large ribosomal subunit protein uL4 n=1 Tax=Methylomonas koyamae TaxID=702114 RepID=A0A291INM4_9GAMM|nr:50S ribosomal protein L4 [Methylomonas koyamae]ATG91808.1 50S ribosomal protein L4 [Methylomonas koyamae]OAI23393.1 50S ribosomal protein L4 [Methylomonas koyamae]
MALQIPAINGGGSSQALEVSEAVFGQAFNETLIHQLVTKYLSAARAGTKAQKNRSAVSGGGLKPFRQKGTGRARAGTTRSPIWRTGGVTFAAQPRSFDQKLNKKMYKAGIRSIFSELLRQGRIAVCNDIIPESPKTKGFLAKIKGIEAKRLLVVADDLNENLILAARNLPYVAVVTPTSVDPVSLVAADQVIATATALKQIEERLA